METMPEIKKIRKAVIPAAGFGTRFLPQTKAMPKEMLPIVDRPVIQYVVEEAVDSGIKDVIIVTGSAKRAIEDHFDVPNSELMKNLKDGGKTEFIEQINKTGTSEAEWLLLLLNFSFNLEHV